MPSLAPTWSQPRARHLWNWNVSEPTLAPAALTDEEDEGLQRVPQEVKQGQGLRDHGAAPPAT